MTVNRKYKSDNNSHLISVIITTYRRKESLYKAICSICEQDYDSIEIIIVDDNADEEWNGKVKKVKEKSEKRYDKSIRLIVNENNKGSAKSRNIGIKAATGEYITFLDDDDIYLKHKLLKQVSLMIEKNADFSLTDMLIFDDNGNLKEKRIRSNLTNQEGLALHKYHMMHHLTGNDTFMFKTSFIKNIGGYRKIDVGDDYYLIEKAILEGGRFVYLHGCYVKAYLHQGEHGGLSSGKKKIDGENILQHNKLKYFKNLNFREKSYVWMRHYAVIAFAEIRRKKYVPFVVYVVISFICNPIGFMIMLLRHL